MSKALQEVYGLTAAQAKYHIRLARAEGAIPARGEPAHRYVVATINRGTSMERNWMVCQACLSSTCELQAAVSVEETA